MPSQKLSIFAINPIDEATIKWNKIVNNLISNDSPCQQCTINEQTPAYVSGYFVYKFYTKQMIYNIDINRFETQDILQTTILKFDLYIDKCLAFLWGSSRASVVFQTILDTASDHQLTITYKKINFSALLRHLLNYKNISFTHMRIKDVIIEKGILATCSVSLKGLDNSHDLVEKYIDNITHLSILLNMNNQRTALTLYSTGAITIYKNREDLTDDIIDMLISILGGTNNG